MKSLITTELGTYLFICKICIKGPFDMSEHSPAIKTAMVDETYKVFAFRVLTGLQRKQGSMHMKNYLGTRPVNLSREVMLFRSQVIQEENKSPISPNSWWTTDATPEVCHHKTKAMENPWLNDLGVVLAEELPWRDEAVAIHRSHCSTLPMTPEPPLAPPQEVASYWPHS